MHLKDKKIILKDRKISKIVLDLTSKIGTIKGETDKMENLKFNGEMEG